MILIRTALLSACGAALLAQSQPGLDPAFFLQDPKAIMVQCADRARASRPEDSRWLAEFGLIYLASGDVARAREAFQRASDLGRKDAPTHRLLALAQIRQQAKAEALAEANRAADLAPKDRVLLGRLGLDFMDAGYAPEGSGFLERAYQLRPSDWAAAVDFGRACLRAKHPDLAATWFRRALTGHTRDAEVYRAVGLAYADPGSRP